MRRVFGLAMAAALVGSTAPSLAVAQQPVIFVGAGPTFPMGEFGDYAKTGWLAHAGVGIPIGDKGLSVGGNVVYGSNKHSDFAGDKTNLPGVFGFLQYRAGDPAKPGFYAYGQVGILNHQYKPGEGATFEGESDWKPAFGGGAGVDVPLGAVNLYVEASLIARSGTNLVPVMAGLAIPVGKK
jgi:hypothetical protein